MHVHAAESETPIQIEVRGSATQYDARREDTSTRIVVTQEEIRKYGDGTLADVLKRQPGISISGGAAGRGGEIRMRGLGAGYTQILLNGTPAPGNFTLDSLAPELVEKIEIQRAATADLSAQAIAGSINIILKRKVQSAQRELKLRAEHSNVFFSPGATLQMSDKAERMSYTVGAEVRNGRFEQAYEQLEDGWDGAGRQVLQRKVARQNNGSFRSLSLTPRINWTLRNGDTLSWQSFVRSQRSHSQSEGTWSATPAEALPAYPFDRSRPEDQRSQLRTDLTWNRTLEQGQKLEAKFGLDAGRQRSREHDAGYGQARQPRLDRDVRNANDGRGATSTGKYSETYESGHQFSAGWDVAQQSSEVARDSLETLDPGAAPTPEQRRYDATLRRLAVYAQDEWSITPRWSTYLGLRWESRRSRSAGSDFGAIGNATNVLSPIIQSLWKLPDSKQDQLRLALSRTYRGEDLERLMPRVTRSLNNSQVAPDRTGNPALQPELAWGIDAALERYGSDGAQMSVAVYARRISNYIHDDTKQVQGRWLALPVNDGRAQSRGIEFDAKFPLRSLLPTVDKVDMRFNLTRNWSSVSNVPGPDNRLASQTPLTANAGLDYRFNASVSGGANFTYRSGGPQRLSASTSSYSSVKRELDMYALWKLAPRAQLRVTAVNLLAEPATEVTRYTDSGGSLRNTAVYPFSAILRLTLELQL
ncbi:TonB-dependent receptor plug domain-containing protein [Rugamonas violacea]|uniref:TonB-dependent receptor plug domain-containing protein n=1 Tax=Rugamonas sp. CCM 8940 TaxID=2765359 RepID=UPI0018F2B416|nr:TonB-dependent receptor [Rugamonas sp. CCM 8940]MBJ7312558.1 TonB-dependent receptor [Rugamonas sp. CCM 8940]